MGTVVAFGFASFALAGGFMSQSFQALKEGTILRVGHLQILDKRAVGRAEETTLEFGLPNAARARAIAAGDRAVAAVLPRIDFVGLATSGGKSVPYLGVGVDPEPEAVATLAKELMAAGRYLEGDGGDGVVLGTGLASALTSRRRRRNAHGDDARRLPECGGCRWYRARRCSNQGAERSLPGGGGDRPRDSPLAESETVSKLVVFLKEGEDEEAAAGAWRNP